MSKEHIQRRSQLPTPLHKAVEAATRTTFRKHGIAEARLITEWPQIAGGVLAGKTLPTRVAFAKGKRDNGTLHLTVSPGWALEVQHLEPQILEKIATYFGYRAVGRLHITQAPLPLKEPRHKHVPAPIAPQAQQRVDNLTAQVEDAELRAALVSLGSAIMREKPERDV